ncbi:hypothetical protein OSTOST_01164 [Ostertagia ostertagi]
MYNNALKALKKELNEQSKGERPIKDGPTIYAAPECGAVKEWHAFATWVIVWPIDTHWEKNAITEIAAACTKHFEEGGKVVSAWTPGSYENIHKWKDTYQIWSLLDEKLAKEAGKDQFFKTSTTKAAKLPALHAPPRTSASRRGGMSGWEETPMIKRSRRA